VSDPGDETTAHEQAPEPSPEPALAEKTAASSSETSTSSSTPPSSAAAESQINYLAAASLVLGAGYFVVGISLGASGLTLPIWFMALPVAAVVVGYVARGQIWRDRQRGRLMANLGVTLGYVGLALLAFGWVLSRLTSA